MKLAVSIALLGLITGTAFGQSSPSSEMKNYPSPWLGLHVLVTDHAEGEKLLRIIPSIAKLGVNALIIETDYSFAFDSDPKVRSKSCVTKSLAREIGDRCRQHGIRPIPALNCLGHQSWAKEQNALLAAYPHLDETPNKYPNNEGIYCRSWCPLHPEVMPIVRPLLDELIDTFQADAVHVGMDEVFIIADPDCPRCAGKDPAELYAKAVNDLHDHLVKTRGVEMLMWADRLLDSKEQGYSRWEASANGTAPAIDLIPRDIILCDWHYDPMPYPSIAYLLGKGFRVWPTGWHDEQAVERMIDTALATKHERMLGYLSTTWLRIPMEQVPDFPATKLAARKLGLERERR
jgi:hypothetical protein